MIHSPDKEDYSSSKGMVVLSEWSSWAPCPRISFSIPTWNCWYKLLHNKGDIVESGTVSAHDPTILNKTKDPPCYRQQR